MRRPARRPVRFALESLEVRSMLSASPSTLVSIDPPPVTSQESTAVVVTIHRQVTAATIDQPLSVEVSTSAPPAGSPTTPLGAQATAARAGTQFESIDETITFPAGQVTEKVAIPVVYGAANPGLLSFNVYATPKIATSKKVATAASTVYLESRADADAPTIVSTRLIYANKSDTAIAITFNKPMDPASVTNLAAYSVTNLSKKINTTDVVRLLFLAKIPKSSASVPLKSATYDPSTNTVTLVPTKPLNPTNNYKVANSTVKVKLPKGTTGLPGVSSVAHPLEDTAGNLLNDHGGFSAGMFQVPVVN